MTLQACRVVVGRSEDSKELLAGWLPIPIVDMQVADSTRSRVAELDRKMPAHEASGRSKRRIVAAVHVRLQLQPGRPSRAGARTTRRLRRGRCSRPIPAWASPGTVWL